MKKIKGCCAAVSVMFLAACINLPLPLSHQEGPFVCSEETTVFIDGKDGVYSVPGCVNYMPEAEISDINPDEIEGEFPYVPENKYHPDQIVMQNLKTRVLAYCRGTEAAKAACVERLECSGFTRITDVPQVSAKYDALKRGTYPTRRWRNGEGVPRW